MNYQTQNARELEESISNHLEKSYDALVEMTDGSEALVNKESTKASNLLKKVVDGNFSPDVKSECLNLFKQYSQRIDEGFPEGYQFARDLADEYWNESIMQEMKLKNPTPKDYSEMDFVRECLDSPNSDHLRW